MEKEVVTAIRQVEIDCQEAIDHEESWKQFCKTVLRRLETENYFVDKSEKINDFDKFLSNRHGESERVPNYYLR